MSSNFLLLLIFTFLSLTSTPCSSKSHVLDFDFPSFFYENFSVLSFYGSSGISSGALQVTFDSGRNDSRKYYNWGRIMYKYPLKVWDPAYDYMASFNISFAVNMAPSDNPRDSENRSLGGGMAFIMVPQSEINYCPEDCSGGWLGLYTNRRNGSDLAMVGIELDTFRDSYDPDDNHVGIDLHTIVSSETKTAPAGVNLSDGNTSVWIDYNGYTKMLHVYLAPGDKGDIKPVDSTLSVPLDLRKQYPEAHYITFGFTGSTGSYFETHCVLRWEFNTIKGIPLHPNRNLLIIALTSALGAVVALVLMAAALFVTHRAGLRRVEKKWPDFTYGPRKFTLKELKMATDNFSTANLLGRGGFGTVYKGFLPSPDNSPVAVKRVSSKSSQGEQEFIAEITTIGRLRHKNLLPLVGWYHDRKGKDLLLVYELMPNGSLDKWLFTNQANVFLHWHQRFKIMHGLGRALLYLHEEWEQVVIHRDVKASNVMLDFEYNARLGDFGLARLITDQEDTETQSIAGTVGYMAPECVQTGIVTPESDVYSFGAVSLEVACGRRPYARQTGHLSHWVWQLHREGKLLDAADSRLQGAYDEEEMRRLLVVGLACCSPDPPRRPSMRAALQSLSKDGPLLQVTADTRYTENSIYPAGHSSRFPPAWTSETRLLVSSTSLDRSAFMTATEIVAR